MNEIIDDLTIDLPEANIKKLQLLVKKAINQIRLYLNKDFGDDEIIKKFNFAIEQIVLDTYNYQQSKQYKNGIVRMSEGDRSIEYNTQSVVTGRIVFTSEVKSMLPTPYVRLMG